MGYFDIRTGVDARDLSSLGVELVKFVFVVSIGLIGRFVFPFWRGS